MGRNKFDQFEEEDGYYQATLPSNIASGTFVQSAADKADYLQYSVDGNRSVQVMSMAFYQGEFHIQRTWVSLRRTLARSEDEC